MYRLYDENNSILENNEIIKPTLSIQDYYDVIDSMLAKYVDIKVIGLSTPGIIRGDQIISMSIKGLEKISITHDFTLKYSQKFVFSNDANTIALGYYSSKENCSSLSFVFQPVSSNSGAGRSFDCWTPSCSWRNTIFAIIIFKRCFRITSNTRRSH